MKTLAEKYPEKTSQFASDGYYGVAEMLRHFHEQPPMAEILGVHYSTISGWLTGKSPGPRNPVEALAREWVKENSKRSPAHPDPIDDAADDRPMFILACKRSDAERIQKLVAFLGCELIEV